MARKTRAAIGALSKDDIRRLNLALSAVSLWCRVNFNGDEQAACELAVSEMRLEIPKWIKIPQFGRR